METGTACKRPKVTKERGGEEGDQKEERDLSCSISRRNWPKGREAKNVLGPHEPNGQEKVGGRVPSCCAPVLLSFAQRQAGQATRQAAQVPGSAGSSEEALPVCPSARLPRRQASRPIHPQGDLVNRVWEPGLTTGLPYVCLASLASLWRRGSRERASSSSS